MSPIIVIVMLALIMMMTYRNMKMMARYRHNKGYIACYQEMLENNPDAYRHLIEYMENESSEEYKNKARVFKIYYELDDDTYQNELSILNFHDWYYKDGKIDKERISYNSDSIIWLLLLMAKANQTNHKDVIEAIYEKMLNEKEAYENTIEYKLIENTHKLFMEGKDTEIPFLNELVIGEYEGLQYDKQLIGMYKRIAEALLAYKGEELDEFYQEDLTNFSMNTIGSTFLKHLEIFDRFNKPTEETLDNDVEEENIEE